MVFKPKIAGPTGGQVSENPVVMYLRLTVSTEAYTDYKYHTLRAQMEARVDAKQ
jgi:hypothetical protein